MEVLTPLRGYASVLHNHYDIDRLILSFFENETRSFLIYICYQNFRCQRSHPNRTPPRKIGLYWIFLLSQSWRKLCQSPLHCKVKNKKKRNPNAKAKSSIKKWYKFNTLSNNLKHKSNIIYDLISLLFIPLVILTVITKMFVVCVVRKKTYLLKCSTSYFSNDFIVFTETWLINSFLDNELSCTQYIILTWDRNEKISLFIRDEEFSSKNLIN